MKLRELALLAGVAAVLAAGGFVVLSGDATPDTEPAPPGATVPAVTQAPSPEPPAVIQAKVDAPTTIQVRAKDLLASGATAGIISGRIQLSAGPAAHIRSYTITVTELRNTDVIEHDTPAGASPVGAFSRTRRFDRADLSHTPYFDFDEVPFSGYGYRVHVTVPGFNGSSAHVKIDESHPIAEVSLSVTPGGPYSILVRDQRYTPLDERYVEMQPVGYPHGRTVHQGQTDSYGSVVFDGVLQGQYDIKVDHTTMQRVTVLTGTRTPQSATVVVPTGRNLRVEVFGPGGFPMEGVALKLYATNTTENIAHDATTDEGGVHEFLYVKPGEYQLDVTATGHGQKSRKVKIGDDDEIEPVIVQIR